MKKPILILMLILVLFSGVYADDISDVRLRVTNIQAPLSGNLPSVTGDVKGYVGEILSKIFSTTGKIKGEFINSFDGIWNKNLNNVVKWNGTSFVTGNIYDTGGLVGIGTSSPDVRLEVNGNIKSLGRTIFLGDTQRLTGDNGSALVYKSNNATTSQILLKDLNEVNYGRVYGNGGGLNFGLLDGDGNWSYLAVKDTYTQFRINDSPKMTLTSSGNVGIGTSNPIQKLDVNGKIVMRSQTESTDANNIVATKGYVDEKTASSNISCYICLGWGDSDRTLDKTSCVPVSSTESGMKWGNVQTSGTVNSDDTFSIGMYCGDTVQCTTLTYYWNGNKMGEKMYDSSMNLTFIALQSTFNSGWSSTGEEVYRRKDRDDYYEWLVYKNVSSATTGKSPEIVKDIRGLNSATISLQGANNYMLRLDMKKVSCVPGTGLKF